MFMFINIGVGLVFWIVCIILWVFIFGVALMNS
jgi:hypothetical protein